MTNDNELVERIKAYFNRLTAWLENALAEFEFFDLERPSDELDQLIAKQKRRATETNGFDAECKKLLAQWNAAKDIRPEDRAAVREASGRAQALEQELLARCNAADKAVRERMVLVRDALDALGRGRGFLKKYRPEEGPASGRMVDRNG